MIPNSFRFVNRMLNVNYMTGVVRHDPENPRQFFLSQTSNASLDVPISLPSPDFVLPPQGQLRTVVAHVRGRTGQYGQTAIAEAISVTQASVLNVNPMSSYLLGFAKRLPKDKLPDGSPYNAAGQLKQEFVDQIKALEDLRPEEKAVIELYEQHSGKMRGRFDSYSNVVLLAGIVDRYSYVPPNQHQRHGQGIVLLRQHKNLSELIPVRLVNNKAPVILERLRRGAPVALKGRLRRKIMPTPDGTGIASDLVLVETDMINPADQAQILPPPPAWYVDYLKREERPAPAEQADASEAEEATTDQA